MYPARIVRDLTKDNFGLLIAYPLPGFVCLLGIANHNADVREWLRATPSDAPTIGGFLYATLASSAAGLVLSAVRWAVVDRALALMGIRAPDWDYGLFAERLAAFETLVAHHYSYYQFYANMLVAVAFAYGSHLFAEGRIEQEAGLFLGVAALEVVLFLGARDTLRKYYAKTGLLLGDRAGRDGREAAAEHGDRRPAILR